MHFLLTGLSSIAITAILISQPTLASYEPNTSADIDEEFHILGEKEGFVPLSARTATKSSLSLIDTPATVTVISRELIDAQLGVDLQDVIRNASGVNQSGNNYGVGDYFQQRGLPVSYAYDGLYGGAGLGPDSYSPTRSLTNVERVEVLQGANATLYGAGSAGGIINLIEKKPQFEAAYNLEGRIGSYDTYGVTADITGPLTDKLAYRLVASTYSSDGFRELSSERHEVYGSVLAKVGENSRLNLSLAWIDDKVQVDSIGYPVRIFNAASTTPEGITAGNVTADNLPNDPASSLQLTPDQIVELANSIAGGDGLHPYDLDGASLISPLSRPNDGEEMRLKLRWEWEAADGLIITPSIQYRTYESNYVRQTGAYNYVYWRRSGVVNQPPRAPLVVDGTLYPFAARRQEYRMLDVNEKSFDSFVDVSYEKDIAGIRNEFLLTAYHQRVNIDVYRASVYDADSSRSADNPVPYILDIRNPNWPSGSFEDYDFYISSNYEKDIRTTGVGFQNISYLTDWFIVRAGAGWNRIKQDFDNGPTDRNADSDPVDQTDNGFVYNFGATVRPSEWSSIFVSYGKGRTSFSFTGSITGVNDRPDSESKNFEVGLKLQEPDGRFFAGLTYFETKRTNLRYNNPLYQDDPLDPEFNISVDEFLFDGEDSTDGWQVDINAYPFERLFINANATWQDARNKQNPTSSTFDSPQKGVPDFFASVYGYYEIPVEKLDGALRVSLGYERQSERTIASASFGLPDAVLPAQGVWDAGLEYNNEQDWSVLLRVKNLTDTLAYDRAMFLGGQPTAPRTFELLFKVKW